MHLLRGVRDYLRRFLHRSGDITEVIDVFIIRLSVGRLVGSLLLPKDILTAPGVPFWLGCLADRERERQRKMEGVGKRALLWARR